MSCMARYSGRVDVDSDGNKKFINNIDFDHGFTLQKFIESEMANELVLGKTTTLQKNTICINFDTTKHYPRVKELLDLCNHVLHEDFKMECDDEFGIHHKVDEKSIVIHNNRYIHGKEITIFIEFNLKIKISKTVKDALLKELNQGYFIKIDNIKLAIGALALISNCPGNYKLIKINGSYWIQRTSDLPLDLWKVYAPLIWDSIKEKKMLTKIIQETCPDLGLQKRLKEISPQNIIIFEDYQKNLDENFERIKAMQFLLDLNVDVSYPEKMDVKDRLMLYIARQFRQVPEDFENCKEGLVFGQV